MQIFYNKLLPKLKDLVLLACDTDSYFVSVRAKSEEEVLKSIEEIMDLSNLPTSHPMYSEKNKRVPG